MELKGKLIIGVVLFIVILGFASLVNELVKGNKEFREEQKIIFEKCSEIESCERYSCLNQLTINIGKKRNNLLQEQNCLLRGANSK